MTNSAHIGPSLTSVAQRWFCHQQLLRETYVVVLQDLKFEGSRVKGFLYSLTGPQTAAKIHDAMQPLKAKIDQLLREEAASSLFSDACETQSKVDPGEPPAEALCRESLFVQSLRSILAESDTSPLAKSFAAVSCACMHAIQSSPLAARALVLPGDSEGVPALDAWSGPPAVAGAAFTFLNSLYVHMSKLVRTAITRGMRASGGTLADVFDGRLFSVVALYATASGGALPHGLAEGAHRLLLAAWPTDFGGCPSLQALLAPLSEQGAEPARAALDRAAASARDGQRGLELASLLPASGTLLKEVLGELSSRLAPYESADDPLLLFATPTGPFRAHHYHSTRPLEDEPDSFSYDLKEPERGEKKGAENRRDKFWVRKQKHFHLKWLQKHARAATRYQESLLAGSPCKPQTISQKMSEEELEVRRVRAVKALLADGSLTRARAVVEKDTGRPGEKAQGRKAKQLRGAAAALSTRKEDKFRQDNLVKHQKKRLEKEMVGFESFKKQLKEMAVLEYLEEMEEMASKSEEIALPIRMHCLEMAANSCPVSCRQRTVYLLCQDIIRQHLAQMTAQDKDKVAKAALGAGFADLHAALLELQALAPTARSDPAAQSSILFQLEQVPDHLLRPTGDGSDKRVQFPPDTWQRKLLDTVDSGNSALVVAPTASGKTFISYYVMEMCLRSGDDGVVVYVAPTKALVNQVRAEIDARFHKCYRPRASKGRNRGLSKLSATFTPDFRDEGMLSAQILVTVPACLGILMLSSVEWASRIRHVIFDEVHSLGESGGEVWEQLILLVDCPFLALSATVGNVQHFHAWLARVEAARGREVVLVEHGERYNDLYTSLWGGQGAGLVPLHPCWVLHKLRIGRRLAPNMFPKDFRLLPEHCASLYRAMARLLPAKEARALDPETFLRGLCAGAEVLWSLSMRQVAAWERALKLALCDLEADAQDVVLEELSKETSATFAASDVALAELGKDCYVRREITSLLLHLKRSDMLPGICFMLDQLGCVRLARLATAELRDLERTQRATNGWLAKRDRLRAECDIAFQRYKRCKQTVQVLPSGETIDDKNDLRSNFVQCSNLLYQHEQPDPEFSFGKITEDAIEDAFKFGMLRPGEHWTQMVPEGLMKPLLRGIAVHHAGMPKHYRQAVERLFRAKRLGVVFATATLSLGINMPAKSSVFVRDAVYLNAMNFRQMAGRAGRRGFDLRGHVVFLGMPSGKCFRLMRSDLPKLHGNLVLNNSMALRLIIRQSALSRLRPRDEEAYQRGLRACWRLVNLPLFDPTSAGGGGAVAGGMMGAQMAHAFRFAMEYLQRMGLVRVDSAGETEPNDLAAFIAHLFVMELANFAFVSLLLADDGRLFQRLCRPGPRRDETVLSVLCHVFMRSPLPASLIARARRQGSVSGPSVVRLPDLSAIGDKVECPDGEEVLEGELVRRALCSEQALRSLEAYCASFASAYAAELGDDDTLPVSGCRLGPPPGGGGAAAAELGLLLGQSAYRPRVRSAFAALSGHGDRFGSVDELSSTLRAGLYLDPQTVPVFELHPAAAPLNSYILNFFMHGKIEALVRYNRIRRDVVWDNLRSFALVLKALHAATARRAGMASADGRPTPFAHPHVLDALESISCRFSKLLWEASA